MRKLRSINMTKMKINRSHHLTAVQIKVLTISFLVFASFATGNIVYLFEKFECLKLMIIILVEISGNTEVSIW
jgi:hypothetical protein